MSISYKSVTEITNLGSEKGGNLTYKDLKRECVARGMPFTEVTGATFPHLTNWLLTNILRKKDDNLLIEYDNYIEDILREKGQNDLIHKSLRLTYLGEDLDEKGETIKRQPKPPKEKKAPKERTQSGLFKGTKKAYTEQLFERGKTLEQTIIKVCRKFPDAKEKSIKIWYNKFKKAKK